MNVKTSKAGLLTLLTLALCLALIPSARAQEIQLRNSSMIPRCLAGSGVGMPASKMASSISSSRSTPRTTRSHPTATFC